MQSRNWKKYNNQLVQRGNLTFLIDPKVLNNEKIKTGGGPRIFSNPLITTLMLVKIQYRLPYLALQGFADSLIALLKVSGSVPTYSLK